MGDEEARLPVALWIELVLMPLPAHGKYYYIQKRGDGRTGIILLKLNSLDGKCRLLIQQRDIEGKLGWVNALNGDSIEESKADAYIQRSILRDPDLWVIEIEDKEMNNPFTEVL